MKELFAGDTPGLPTAARGWHSRGYLPHLDAPGLVQMVTFRLFDTVPANVIRHWREELGIGTNACGLDSAKSELRRRLESYEDSGRGNCHLANVQVAAIVEDSMLYFDGSRYALLAWCIMPNHVHVLLQTTNDHALGAVVASWKSYTAKAANRVLGRSGQFWAVDYYDRFIRNDAHLAACIDYIERNPVVAGLCTTASDWRFSSNWRRNAP